MRLLPLVPLLLAAGVLGAAGASIVGDGGADIHRTVVVNQSNNDDAFDKDVQVFCPKGYSPVGGGGIIPHGNDTPGVALYWSAPYQTGWEVAAQDTRRKTHPWVLTAYVVCVKPAIEDTGLPGNTLTVQ
jgi:hypothetical protein